MKYTVLMTYYNQEDRIKRIVKSWNDQSVPPELIVILDDGSDKLLRMDEDNVLILRFKHSGNVSHNLNIGYRLVKTPYMVITGADLFYNKIFAEKSMELLETLPPMSMPVGQFILTDTFNTKGMVAPGKTFGRTTNYTTNGEVIKNPVAEGWMRRTDEYLYNCEDYNRWGYEDTDYKFRFQLAGGKYYGYNFLKMYHLNHPNNRGWKKGSNKELFSRKIKYYKENNITRLK